MGLPAELQGAQHERPADPDPYAVSDAHALARDLRVPLFRPDDETTRTDRIELLGDYMLLAAFYLGEIHAERLELHQVLGPLEHEWTRVQAPGGGKTRTSQEEAKAVVHPAMAKRIHELRWRVDRLSEEIIRLDRDHDKVSRTYTVMTGA